MKYSVCILSLVCGMCCMSFSSCHFGQDEKSDDDDISDNPNASFLVFLKDFFTDSLYRHESLQLPLQFRFYSEEDEGMIETELSYEEWSELYNDLPRLDDIMYNVDYGQSLISSNRKSLLLKGLSNGLSMKFHFGFSEGRWQLMEVE